MMEVDWEKSPVNWRNLPLKGAWDKLLKSIELLPEVYTVYPSGSRYICLEAIHEGSDVDVVVYGSRKVYAALLEMDYQECGGNSQYADDIRAYRKGSLNLIVYHDYTKYLQTIAATELCRVHYVADKEDRYRIHETTKGENNG